MGYQPPLRVDDIGVSALADLDLRHHVPDQLEINLGNAHARVAPGAGNGERHIRLGFAAEIDRPVIHLVRHRFREPGILGEVDVAADHVHGQPRDPQALFAAGIELRQLGNGGHLAQQPQGIEPALLDRSRRPRELCRPTELALDLFDELADFRRGGLRLFALNTDERRFVLLIVEQHVEHAVTQQSDRDDRHEQRDIFGEQAPAGPWDRSHGRRLMLHAVAWRRSRCREALKEIANPHPHHCTRAGVRCVRRWAALPPHSITAWRQRAAPADVNATQ